jgi:DNA-binding NarL/FixJ family response regulator
MQERVPADNGLQLRRLSPRESEVLEQASHGLRNSEIAGALNVTVHAVKFHLGAIYRKLGVANRTEAVVVYLTNGAPDLPSPEERLNDPSNGRAPT